MFPFTFKGKKHYKCIIDWVWMPWCATTSNFDKDGKWENCLPSKCSILFHTISNCNSQRLVITFLQIVLLQNRFSRENIILAGRVICYDMWKVLRWRPNGIILSLFYLLLLSPSFASFHYIPILFLSENWQNVLRRWLNTNNCHFPNLIFLDRKQAIGGAMRNLKEISSSEKQFQETKLQ